MKEAGGIHIAANRKAGFQYQVSGKVEAGIKLTGTEIKSIRARQVNISDAHCFFIKDELWIKGMYIAEYREGSYANHEPRRLRKLLLKAAELRKLRSRVREKGFTIVPVRLYINARGYAKLEIGLAKGKKKYDKREDVKQRDSKRELDRMEKAIRNR